MARRLSWTDVSRHNLRDDLFLVIEGKVYDVTQFQYKHPGGIEFLLDQGGTDVTELFDNAGHSKEARSILRELCIGVVKDKGPRSDLGKGEEQNILQSTNEGKSSDSTLAMLVLVGMAFWSCGFFWASGQIMKWAEDLIRAR